MTVPEATQLTISQATDLISRGQLNPLDLTRMYLERIHRFDPRLNCFITVTENSALSQAGQAESEIQAGGTHGALHGIPLALKDLYETAGVLTTHGTTFYENYVPSEDSHVVSKLKAAGCVMLGKTNMHEIALGVTNVNPHYGACRNPWDTERMTGGSSGGSAAAVAAGLCMAALGSDTGGSIRIPSSLCGVVGLKPTFGRVSLWGVIPLSWTLDHAGPITRSVRDAAILLEVMAGYDPEDPGSIDMPVPDYLAELDSGIQGWRVALAEDAYVAAADAGVLQAVRIAARVFEKLGAHVDRVDFPDGHAAAVANSGIATSDAAAFHRERLESHPEGFGSDVLQRLQTGAARTSSEYALFRHEQARIRRNYERFFEQYDILLTPTTPVAAPFIEGPDAIEQARLLTRFTAPFNLTGLPALSIPCGFTPAGLPVGLQLVARPWGEAALLRAGEAFEKATEWHTRWPDGY